MNPPTFEAPALETMNRLLPAFDFAALIIASPNGAVYMAKQRSLERNVAIKILSPDVSARPDFRDSFDRTARAMARLNHPNLIGVYDSGFVQGMLYFVMEFVPGKSLEHSSRGHRVELTQALKLTDSICEGLIHAHSHGIIHGNLSLANILLNQKAEPKIGNFGFSHPDKVSRDDGSRTSPFAAPELADLAVQPTPASDIHSIGAILYQLVTATAHSAEAPVPSGQAGIPAEIDGVWRKATHPDPKQRYQDVRELQKALAGLGTGPRNALLKPAAAVAVPAGKATPDPKKATVGDAAADPPQSPPKTQPVHRVGFNWKLLRNLVIIGGLLYAIQIAWQRYQEAQDRNNRLHLDALAKQKAEKDRKLAEARNRPIQSPVRSGSNSNGTGSVIPEPPPPPETPEQSLERLRNALSSGDRKEMPKGSIRRGENDYMLISAPLTWSEAAWFAERHGAHLAIPNASADLTWLVTKAANSNAIWIGGGRSGRNSWTLADGTPWLPKKEPAGIGNYLGADKHGLLRAAAGHVKLPFVIQWHQDGKNPGALPSVLAATGASIAAGKPVFPPGIRVFDNRLYLHVSRDISWRTAADLAASAGGHLAVASDIPESSNLMEITADLSPGTRLWLGGFRKDGQWVWLTGEPWKTAKWAPDAVKEVENTALFIRPKTGWDAADTAESLSGFIIEWSSDRKGRPSSQ